MTASTAVRLATHGYRAILRLYPRSFRADYGQEMLAVFEALCQDRFERGGWADAARLLLQNTADTLGSISKEYWMMVEESFPNGREARQALALGVAFLIGTWAALFFLAFDAAPGWASLPVGAAVVAANALLAARAVVRSERFQFAPGMAAMANLILAAGICAIGSAALPPVVIGVGQVGLVTAHAALLWRVRGEDILASPLMESEGG